MTSEQDITVTLIGPAKINGSFEPVGKTVTISNTVALELEALGAIGPLAGVAAVIDAEKAETEAAIAASLLEIEALHAARREDGLRLDAVMKERDDAHARITELEAAAAASATLIAKLEAEAKTAAERITGLEETISGKMQEAEDAATADQNTPKGGKKGAASTGN